MLPSKESLLEMSAGKQVRHGIAGPEAPEGRNKHFDANVLLQLP